MNIKIPTVTFCFIALTSSLAFSLGFIASTKTPARAIRILSEIGDKIKRIEPKASETPSRIVKTIANNEEISELALAKIM